MPDGFGAAYDFKHLVEVLPDVETNDNTYINKQLLTPQSTETNDVTYQARAAALFNNGIEFTQNVTFSQIRNLTVDNELILDSNSNVIIGYDASNELQFNQNVTSNLVRTLSVQNELVLNQTNDDSFVYDFNIQNEISFNQETTSGFIYNESASSELSLGQLIEINNSPPIGNGNSGLAFSHNVSFSKISTRTRNVVALYPEYFRDDDLSNYQGGNVSLNRTTLRPMSNVRQIQLVSDSQFNTTQVYRIDGVNQLGVKVSEFVTLNGTNPVLTVNHYSRLNKITKESGNSIVGRVIISNPDTIELAILFSVMLSPTGVEITEAVGFLSNATSHPFKNKTFYEKFFIANYNESDVHLTIQELIDSNNNINFAIDYDLDSVSVNRTVRPASVPIGQFTSATKTLTLTSGNSIGVWLQVSVPAKSIELSKQYVLKVTANNIIYYYTIFGRPLVDNWDDINVRRSKFEHGGFNPPRFMELYGAKEVEFSNIEPDPNSFRNQYYYNSRLNQLFRKTSGNNNLFYWKKVN